MHAIPPEEHLDATVAILILMGNGIQPARKLPMKTLVGAQSPLNPLGRKCGQSSPLDRNRNLAHQSIMRLISNEALELLSPARTIRDNL